MSIGAICWSAIQITATGVICMVLLISFVWLIKCLINIIKGE